MGGGVGAGAVRAVVRAEAVRVVVRAVVVRVEVMVGVVRAVVVMVAAWSYFRNFPLRVMVSSHAFVLFVTSEEYQTHVTNN